MKHFLSNSFLYFWIRNILTGGIPYRSWIKLFHLDDPNSNVMDLGCGPADIFRFIDKHKPNFYLGLDISDQYIGSAKEVLDQNHIKHKLLVIDLTQLGSNPKIDQEMIDLAEKNKIDKALLIGVYHHLSDESVLNTLNVLFQIPSLISIYSQDILLNQNFINNFFTKLDRGEFIRTEADYETLFSKSKWKFEKFWTNAGISSIKYIHFKFTKI